MKPRAWIVRSLLLLLGILTVAGVLRIVERGVRAAALSLVLPTGPGRWIWASSRVTDGGPIAFFAVRDFEIGAAPERARLFAVADEGYLAFLNGHLVGGGNLTAGGGAVDAYEVAPFLRAGPNRLVAELRSSRGVGAFLAALEIEGAEPRRIVTDGEWRIFWQVRRKLLDGTDAVEGGARVRVWGAPPVGRWGAPWRIRELPVFEALSSAQEEPLLPAVVLGWREGEGWVPLPGPSRFVSGEGAVLFDWGKEVTGYLGLRFKDSQPVTARIHVGGDRPDPFQRSPDIVLAGVPGRRSWHDVRPRRLRYAMVLGLEGVAVEGRVFPTDPVASAALLEPEVGRRGAFGLEPPRLRAPVEHEVRGELEGVPGGPGGESG